MASAPLGPGLGPVGVCRGPRRGFVGAFGTFRRRLSAALAGLARAIRRVATDARRAAGRGRGTWLARLAEGRLLGVRSGAGPVLLVAVGGGGGGDRPAQLARVTLVGVASRRARGLAAWEQVGQIQVVVGALERVGVGGGRGRGCCGCIRAKRKLGARRGPGVALGPAVAQRRPLQQPFGFCFARRRFGFMVAQGRRLHAPGGLHRAGRGGGRHPACAERPRQAGGGQRGGLGGIQRPAEELEIGAPRGRQAGRGLQLAGGRGQHQVGVGGRRVGQAGIVHPQGHDGDVVVAAALEGDVDEKVGQRLALHGHHGLAELVVFHQVAQAVGAHQKLVAVLERHQKRVDLDLALKAHRAGDDVFEAAVLGLLGPQQAGADLLVDQRVIFGDLHKAAAALDVAARVAHVGDVGPARPHQQHGAGGAHAGKLRIGGGRVKDGGAGGADGVGQQARHRRRRIVVGGRRRVGQLLAVGADVLGQHLAGQPGSVRPTLVAAHAVGHAKQPKFGDHHVGVFVAFAHPPDVGLGCGINVH